MTGSAIIVLIIKTYFTEENFSYAARGFVWGIHINSECHETLY